MDVCWSPAEMFAPWGRKRPTSTWTTLLQAWHLCRIASYGLPWWWWCIQNPETEQPLTWNDTKDSNLSRIPTKIKTIRKSVENKRGHLANFPNITNFQLPNLEMNKIVLALSSFRQTSRERPIFVVQLETYSWPGWKHAGLSGRGKTTEPTWWLMVTCLKNHTF